MWQSLNLMNDSWLQVLERAVVVPCKPGGIWWCWQSSLSPTGSTGKNGCEVLLFSVLASVEALVADLGSVRAADHVGDYFSASAALFGSANQLAGLRNKLVQGGDCILGRDLEWLPALIRLSFVCEEGDGLRK